jgi:hypothetical protein
VQRWPQTQHMQLGQMYVHIHVQEMRWQAQDVQKQEQQTLTRMLIQAAGRARRRGVRSTLHWIASLTQQHTQKTAVASQTMSRQQTRTRLSERRCECRPRPAVHDCRPPYPGAHTDRKEHTHVPAARSMSAIAGVPSGRALGASLGRVADEAPHRFNTQHSTNGMPSPSTATRQNIEHTGSICACTTRPARLRHVCTIAVRLSESAPPK